MLNFIKCIWYVEKNLLLPNSHQVIDNYIELLIKLVCPGVIKSLPMKNSIIMLCRSPSKSFSHLSHLQFYLKIWHIFSCEFYEISKNTFFTEHLLCQLLQVESKGITYKDIFFTDLLSLLIQMEVCHIFNIRRVLFRSQSDIQHGAFSWA